MKDFLILKVLDRFQWIFNRLGIDYRVMRKILQLKLIMDERRVPTIMMGGNHKKEEGNVFKKSLLMYGLMGLIFMLLIFPPFPLFYKMNMILGVILFMVTTAMIGDYSAVLLDVKEKNILLPKPIDVKTINAAKVLHILIYLFSIMLSIAAPTLVVGSIRYGIGFGGILIVQLIFMAGFIIFSTSMLYFVLLHFFTGEKLKDIINYFQIIITIVMVLLYQLVGRVFEIFDFEVVYSPKWWNYLIPPVWFSAPFSIFIEGLQEPYYIIFSILGVVVPIFMVFLYFKTVAPYFENALQKLNNNSGRSKKKETKGWLRKKLVGIISKDPVERVFFRFTHHMIASERNLKLKLYPGLAFATVLPLVFIFSSVNTAGSLEAAYEQLKVGKFYLFLYFSVSMLANTVPMLGTSEKNKAAWIYDVLPIDHANTIHRGALKAFIIKYILPVYGGASLLFFGVYGFRILPDVFLILLNLLLLIIVIFHYSQRPLPFSQDFEYIKHNNMKTVFQAMAFSGVSVALHLFFIRMGFSVLIYAAILLLVLIFVWRKSFSSR